MLKVDFLKELMEQSNYLDNAVLCITDQLHNAVVRINEPIIGAVCLN